MTKYDLVVYYRTYEQFLESLRELGLVDVTTTTWEPGEGDRALLSSIEQHRRAIARLQQVAAAPGYKAANPFETAADTLMEYHRVTTDIEVAAGQATRLRKEADELRVWGDFDPAQVGELIRSGVELRYFTAPESVFATNGEEWAGEYVIEKIASQAGMTYFVAVTAPGEELSLAGAQEVRIPLASVSQRESELQHMATRMEYLEKELARCASSVHLLEADLEALKEKLDFHRVRGSATCGPEGMLMVLEGWATRADAPRVEAFLEQQTDIVWIASHPTPEDDTPVLLKNRKFPRLFELIGDLYAMPRYGSMDLTPWFAPFYMLFFAFCLGDGGYGLILLLGGILLKLKGGPKLAQAAGLTMFCGGATVVFGLLTASVFGIKLDEFALLKSWTDRALQTEQLFTLALVLGFIQLMLAMGLRAAHTIAAFGLRYALSILGWMLLLLSAGVAVGMPMLVSGFDAFTPSSPAFMACMGVGLVLMLFFNSPGKNVFSNFGTGLWNTYNDVIGFAGDILSYIRLFALGLSGGTLALVFNDVAAGLSPDIPVVKQLVMLLILLIGHGINLFMSLIGSFVHPMRLTFLEFYKNAGFESTQRRFTPFRKTTNK